MKKSKFNKILITIISSAIIGGIGLNSSSILGVDATAGITVEAAETFANDTVDVATADEFQAALLDVNVTTINVTGNITMTRNIVKIPARDFEIIGNKDQGFTIDSKKFILRGQQGKRADTAAGKNNTLKITNANIVGNVNGNGFFTGGSGTGQASFGWDVYATDVNYTGSRFLNLSEGKLTFAGQNEIKTRAENAWVHDLEFISGSTYNGQAATEDGGQFSAFYFNGSLINRKANGKVNIGDGAKVDVAISPQSDANYHYPVFYDKVYQVNVASGAELNVDAAGVAFQFVPRCDYQNIPSLNLAEDSIARFNGRGGGDYQAVKLQQYGTQINQDQRSRLYIDGNSKNGAIESIAEFSAFNVYGAAQLSLANHLPNAPIFRGDRTFIKGAEIKSIFTWNRDGGTYPDTDIKDRFSANGTFDTYVGLYGDCDNTDTSAEVFSRDANVREQFQMKNYGKVIFTAGNNPNGN